jgi:hypothetical protein
MCSAWLKQIFRNRSVANLKQAVLHLSISNIMGGNLWQSAELKAKFEKLYDTANKMVSDVQLVTIWQKMIDLLLLAQLAYEAMIPCLHMGVHPRNRGAKKMNPVTMHRKGSKVMGVGFNIRICNKEKAVAVENNPTSNNCEKHTMELTKDSDMFANYVPGTVRAGSLGCSHLNQYLAAGACGAKTPFTAHVADEGSSCMSKSRMMELNDDLAKVMETGLTWTVVKWQVEEAYPKLPDIAQRALNIEHHIGEGMFVHTDGYIAKLSPTVLRTPAVQFTNVGCDLYIKTTRHNMNSLRTHAGTCPEILYAYKPQDNGIQNSEATLQIIIVNANMPSIQDRAHAENPKHKPNKTGGHNSVNPAWAAIMLKTLHRLRFSNVR